MAKIFTKKSDNPPNFWEHCLWKNKLIMAFAFLRHHKEAFTMSTLRPESQAIFTNYVHECEAAYQYAEAFFNQTQPAALKESATLGEQLLNLDDWAHSELFIETIKYTKLNCPEFYQAHKHLIDNCLEKQKIDKQLKKWWLYGLQCDILVSFLENHLWNTTIKGLEDVSQLKELYVEAYAQIVIANQTCMLTNDQEYTTEVKQATKTAKKDAQATITADKPELKIFLLDVLNPEKRWKLNDITKSVREGMYMALMKKAKAQQVH